MWLISGSFYNIVLLENVTRLTHGCERSRNVIHLHEFSAIEPQCENLPLTLSNGIHMMPPVNTTRFTRWGYSSAGR
ncbi:hypothetical protein, partial [Leclercia sp.]|uniref:hypothetical protein n=1 Tax=Leclercia sp. TaxID=1898428 RepID=UPI0028AAA063